MTRMLRLTLLAMCLRLLHAPTAQAAEVYIATDMYHDTYANNTMTQTTLVVHDWGIGYDPLF